MRFRLFSIIFLIVLVCCVIDISTAKREKRKEYDMTGAIDLMTAGIIAKALGKSRG